jgi:hypothetical protein
MEQSEIVDVSARSLQRDDGICWFPTRLLANSDEKIKNSCRKFECPYTQIEA